MAIWKDYSKAETGFAFGRGTPVWALDLIGLAAVSGIVGLFLVRFVPLQLVMPVLSVASFGIACAAGVIGHVYRFDRRARGLTPWDVAVVFTVIWIGAGMLSDPKHIIDMIEQPVVAAQ
jgi:hypothetical protein